MKLVKAHALGNDFLLVAAAEVSHEVDRATMARQTCDRHRGIGADGLIVYERAADALAMRLLNADGSCSEISGNGVRCLGAWIAALDRLHRGAKIDVQTDAGVKTLELLSIDGLRYTFRTSMGQPTGIDRVRLAVGGEQVDAVTLRIGNPQCVVLGEVTELKLETIAARLAVHPHFPEGTNVELAAVEGSELVRILIWERGVGPTEASGTGACAAAVAAHRYGGASRDVEVVSPGGTQRVEWRDDSVYLTGWAELIAEARWIRSLSGAGIRKLE